MKRLVLTERQQIFENFWMEQIKGRIHEVISRLQDAESYYWYGYDKGYDEKNHDKGFKEGYTKASVRYNKYTLQEKLILIDLLNKESKERPNSTLDLLLQKIEQMETI